MITDGVGAGIPMAAVSTGAQGGLAKDAYSRRGRLQRSHFDAEIEQQGQLKVTTGTSSKCRALWRAAKGQKLPEVCKISALSIRSRAFSLPMKKTRR